MEDEYFRRISKKRNLLRACCEGGAKDRYFESDYCEKNEEGKVMLDAGEIYQIRYLNMDTIFAEERAQMYVVCISNSLFDKPKMQHRRSFWLNLEKHLRDSEVKRL